MFVGGTEDVERIYNSIAAYFDERTPTVTDPRAPGHARSRGPAGRRGTAGTTGLWWLMLPAALLYLWLVRAAAAETAEPFAWIEPDLRGLAPPHREWARAAVDVQVRLSEEMRTAPGYLQESMQSIWQEVQALGSSAAHSGFDSIKAWKIASAASTLRNCGRRRAT